MTLFHSQIDHIKVEKTVPPLHSYKSFIEDMHIKHIEKKKREMFPSEAVLPASKWITLKTIHA